MKKIVKVDYSVLLGSPFCDEPITIKKLGGKRRLKVESIIKDQTILDQIAKYDQVRRAFRDKKNENVDEFIKQQFLTAFMLFNYLPENYFVIDYGRETEEILKEKYHKIYLNGPRVDKNTLDQIIDEYIKENKLEKYIRLLTFSFDKSYTTHTILLLKKQK